jgi:PleD family two-component response regulator
MDIESDHMTTPIDEKKKRTSEILLRVDQLIKSKELSLAILEIALAKEIDPSNFYTSALEERVKGLLAQQDTSVVNNPQTIAVNNKNPKVETNNLSKSSHQESFHPLQYMQDFLSKTNTVPGQNQQMIHSIAPNPRTEKKQERMNVSSAPKIIPSLVKRSPKVLMIDDDVTLLSVLSMTIQSGGFEVIPLTTSDEAFALLRRLTPDIILCDINLETSTMGGFTFFEKIQEIDRLKSIPFIFLTGLNDEVLVRTGKEMGADDYLTKPITGQNLLATLRGRVKRFEQLRHIPMLLNPNSNVSVPGFGIQP